MYFPPAPVIIDLREAISVDTSEKKRLKNDYKKKPAVGAVYCIECGGNKRRYIKSTMDIGGIKNRFSFAMAIGSCPDPALRREWSEYGNKSLSLTVLEELEMGEDQTDGEFAKDIELLLELWREKSAPGGEK